MLRTERKGSAWCIAPVMVCLAGTASASVTISAAPTSSMNCAAGVCAPTASSANLNTTDLQTMLAAGDVKVTTGSSANDIDVADAVTWASTHRLTLQAQHSLAIDAVVAVEGTAALTLVTNHGGSGGTFSFGAPGRIDFWDVHSKLKINGLAYKLVGDMKALIRLALATPAGAYAMAKDFALHGVYGSAPIALFEGRFDGLGHMVSGMRIRARNDSNIGMFGDAAGWIGHLHITGATIAHGNYAGILAGSNYGVIDGVTADGLFVEVANVGGIAGTSNNTIENSSGTVRIKGHATQTLGGVAAENTGLIDRSHGTLAAGPAVTLAGGLVARADAGSRITNSSGNVDTIANATAGGLAGVNFGSISGSYASGMAESFNDEDSEAGGLVANNQGSIVDCYATTAVKALGRDTGGAAGGLVGLNYGTIATSYAIGTAIAGNLNQNGGGLIGGDHATNGVSASYWDMDTSGITNPSQGASDPANDPGITGLTDTQLKSGLPSGFSASIWGQSAGINNGDPYLLANVPQ